MPAAQPSPASGPIFLWAHPRSRSTAFERAVYTLKDQVVVEHEPFSQAYYFSSERRSPIPYYQRNSTHTTAKTYDQVVCDLVRPREKIVFGKDMALNVLVDGSPVGCKQLLEQLSNGPGGQAVHTFLIRNPKDAIASLDKMQAKMSLYDGVFQSSEIGIKEVAALHAYITQELGQKSIIVDSDDLVTIPEQILPQWCEAVGLEFSNSMLEWENDDVPTQWAEWDGWHDDAKNSNGFVKQTTVVLAPEEEKVEVSQRSKQVANAVKEAMPYYLELYGQRIKAVES